MFGNVPAIIRFDDYHEISYFEDKLQQIFPSLNVFELGSDYYYFALVYDSHNPPSLTEVGTLLSDKCLDDELLGTMIARYTIDILGER